MSANTSRQSHPQSTATGSHDRFAVSFNTALLTRPEVAQQLATCLRSVDELIASGDLPVVRIGRSVRIRPSALEFLIEARETRANPRRRTSARKVVTSTPK